MLYRRSDISLHKTCQTVRRIRVVSVLSKLADRDQVRADLRNEQAILEEDIESRIIDHHCYRNVTLCLSCDSFSISDYDLGRVSCHIHGVIE